MDGTERLFDAWARNGRAEAMQREHAGAVVRILGRAIKYGRDDEFAFLDVGCGNGWLVREMVRRWKRSTGMGIDKSKNMVRSAEMAKESQRETYRHTELELLRTGKRFNCIIAMESMYYLDSVSAGAAKVLELLLPAGVFLCGTDFYSENRLTAGWAKKMNVKMHLRPEREWREMLESVGFDVAVRHVRDKKSGKKWRREFGTLFLICTKPDSGTRGTPTTPLW